MNLTSWGNYPKIKAIGIKFSRLEELKNILHRTKELIPYGCGKSYGDSALNNSVIHTKAYDYFLDFDREAGILHVQAGATLADILKMSVPLGWFLQVTPGTKLISVGGAIASDVHGKNHHIAGCFSETVINFTLMLPNGDTVNCSKNENTELFQATCGGMGLTGVIVDAKIQLKKINSKFIQQTTIKNKNLQETFAAFEDNHDATYSVAWIDCLAKGEHLGKSLLMVGDFCDDGRLVYKPKDKLSIPFYFPAFCLNALSVKAFNFLYYAKVRKKTSHQKVDLDSFFYPLDAIHQWNRIYGKPGFVQYQFILPKAVSYEGLERILNTIAQSGKGSFLAVLKLYGAQNANYLSFPIEGYSLALDFKVEPALFALLDKLDDIVHEYQGRIYLAKDARLSKAHFEQGYPQAHKFKALRETNKMNKKFNSLQSKRLGI